MTLGSSLAGTLGFYSVVPNMSTRGQALLAALGLHREAVIAENGKKRKAHSMSN